jgi:AcrR family transcriptional regulator
MIDTKTRILDTAERLFSEQGYAATSLRLVIAKARVNLAAIHYHFGSKEELIEQVVMRKIGPVNIQRLQLLDRFEAEAGKKPLPVEKVLEAFLLPAFMARKRSPNFVKLMGRLYGEGIMPKIAESHFGPMMSRFRAAFAKALPDLPELEQAWRIHFMIGAMAHMLRKPPDEIRQNEQEPPERLVRRLIAFLSAGFRAPLIEDDPR